MTFDLCNVIIEKKGVLYLEDKIIGIQESIAIVNEDIELLRKEIEEIKEKNKLNSELNNVLLSEKKEKFKTLMEIRIKLENYCELVSSQIEERYLQDPFMSKKRVKDRLRNEFKKYGNLIIAFDFDYTVHSYHDEDYTYDFIAELLREWRPYSRLIVFTASPESRYPYIENYLNEHNIPFDKINDEVVSERHYTRKVYYNVFLDDRAGLGETAEILYELLEEIKNGELEYNSYEYFGELTRNEKRVVDILRKEGMSDKEILETFKDILESLK